MATTIQTLREATPARWQAALARAIAEGVQVRQLAGCGAWIATSGTDAATAYEVGAGGCECQAGPFGDPICKHRAAYWHAQGLLDLDLDPEPEPTAPTASASVPCWACKGSGREWIEGASGDWFRVACIACYGTGEAGEEGDEPADDAGGDAETGGRWSAPHRGLTPAQVVALKADALRHAVAHAAPLVDPFTGRVIDRHNCRDAA